MTQTKPQAAECMLKLKVTLKGQTAMTKRNIDEVLSSENIFDHSNNHKGIAAEMNEIDFILPMCKQIC